MGYRLIKTNNVNLVNILSHSQINEFRTRLVARFWRGESCFPLEINSVIYLANCRNPRVGLTSVLKKI